MNSLINLKNNLIQNFYIIGFSPEDFFYKNQNDEGEFLNIFKIKSYVNIKPKIISKFPPNNSNFNGVNDETIINHCFPNGFHLIKKESKETNPTFFYFELDNLLLNYSLDEKNIHSKMYFTCIEILEPLSKYSLYKEEIIKELEGKIQFKDTDKFVDDKYEKIFIPKILCFASILPYYNELKGILNIIYQNFLDPSNPYKLEKLIEQIVLRIPIPLNDHYKLIISFDSNKFKEKISFPLYKMKEENLRISFTSNFSSIFYFFNEDEILKILKYIILELPILFFCDDMNRLTSTIENFLSLISPFKYVHPFISVLPQKFYGFISVEKKFIFGINQNYNKYFFRMNEIDIDKNIVIVYFEKNKGKIGIISKQNEENNSDVFILKEENNNDDIEESNSNNKVNFISNNYVLYNGTKTDLVDIDIPSLAKKKFCEKLHGYINKLKEHSISNFDYTVRKCTYDFFVSILSGYTDYYLKSKYFNEAYNTKNCGFELLYKTSNQWEINDLNFVKEIFNFDEFVNKSDNPLFYFVFCQTKLFVNFLRERIYLNNKNYLMQYRQFDQVCFLKKHKDFRKKKENKGIYEEFKKITAEKSNKNQKLTEIKLINEDFTQAEKDLINKKSKEEILTKYAQNINPEKGSNSMKYYLFPKLLFDDEFFETPYENLYLMHNIDMPSGKIIDDYKKLCSLYSLDYYKLRGYMFPPKNIENLPETNNSKANFGITSYYYIFYNWIILLCCSLTYCEPIERIVRLNEIIPVLDKLYYIEEIVIKLIFDTFIKYGNKMQCIKIFEKVNKFYGYSNYLFLNLLTNKLCQEEVNYDDYLNNKKEYIIKDRSIILSSDNFIKKRMTMSPESNDLKNNDSLNIFRSTMMFNNGIGQKKYTVGNNIKKQESNYKEKIIFSSQQYCKKCKCYNSFDFEEIKKQKLSKINYTYKCIKCKAFSNDVYIKYQILLNNKKRKELYITKMGEFKLLPPNRLYTELMFNLSSQKNFEINIEAIQNQFNFMNYIFYFSIENLSFDFLFPYRKIPDENVELIQNNLGFVISDINKRRFSVINNEKKNDLSNINKGLVENKENGNFIPIDISKYDNFDKYYNLIPCIIDNEQDEFYENINENNIEDYKSTNYFSINGNK